MSDIPEPFVFDVHGVLAWANATGNEEKVFRNDVASGRAVIYNRVWGIFQAAYPDEATKLGPDSFQRAPVTDEHREAGAALAEREGATFGSKGPYAKGAEWWMAGIAACGPYTIVTDERRKAFYEKIDGLAVVTVEEYLALH